MLARSLASHCISAWMAWCPLVLLTGIVMFTGVLISWGDDKHVKASIQIARENFAFLFLLAGGVFACLSRLICSCCSSSEIAVFPMYLLIAIWDG